MDIHEGEDTAGAEPGSWAGRWARLNHELNGRGVRDPDEAVLDIYLGELYAPFMDIFKNEHITALSRFFMADNPESEASGAVDAGNSWGSSADFIETFKQPVLAFVNTAAKYLAGVKGGYEPFQIKDAELTPVSAEETWKEFAAFMERLILLADAPETEGLKDRPWAVSLVLGYGMLTLLKSILGKESTGALAAELADHWQIVRKVRESWEKLGLPGHEAGRMADLARAVLARTAPSSLVTTRPAGIPGKTDALAAAIIYDNYEADDFRSLLGVNRFEDATWFNKEAFEEAVSRSCLFLLPESAAAFGGLAFGGLAIGTAEDSEAAWKQRMDTIAGVAMSLTKAEAASGYRLDAVVEALTGGMPKKVPKPAKPRNGKK
jgi:hypothetical protein